MPDLLAHALIAYTICLVLAWPISWISPKYITVGIAGAFIPDLSKIELLLDSAVVEHSIGLPFDWFSLHTGGGVIVSITIGALLVPRRERLRVGFLLSIGAASHLVADLLLLTPSGRSFPVLWPISSYSPPTPGLYLSTQPGPTIAALGIAIGAWGISRVLS